MTEDDLAALAETAGLNSYSPYSKVRVGCVLETADGALWTGCNIENSSFGLTICAERTAVGKAVSDGANRIIRAAIWSDTGFFLPPCGACLQVLSEFMADGDIILVREDGEIQKHTLRALMPQTTSGLKEKLQD